MNKKNVFFGGVALSVQAMNLFSFVQQIKQDNDAFVVSIQSENKPSLVKEVADVGIPELRVVYATGVSSTLTTQTSIGISIMPTVIAIDSVQS